MALSARGGDGNYHWKISHGTAPGLTLDERGLLAGTVTSPLITGLQIQVTDSQGASASSLLALEVVDLAPPKTTERHPLIKSKRHLLPDVIEDLPYTAPLVVENALEPLRWKLVTGELPKGLSLHQGRITGASPLSTEKLYTFSLEMTDATGLQLTQEFGLVTKPKPPKLWQRIMGVIYWIAMGVGALLYLRAILFGGTFEMRGLLDRFRRNR